MNIPNAIQEFLSSLERSFADNSFVKLSLGNYKGFEAELKNIYVRKVLIKREEKLSFTLHYKTRDIVKNHAIAESISVLQQYLMDGFRAATLCTAAYDLHMQQHQTGKITLKKSSPSHKTAPSLNHDQEKKRLISAKGKTYLHALNLTDAEGNVFKNAQDKYRQINKYIEILSGLIIALPPEKLGKIVDMGSGKGYLTFALYDYMTHTLGLHPLVTGVEQRADMVGLCNQIAMASGFENLHFVQDTIENYDSTGTSILIALHACDIATDQAIYKGINAGAELIVVAPCCHKQIRRQMEKHKASNELDFLMQHGIFMERQAEMVTDGMRSLILQYFGYDTKIFEFISDAHTAKNVMIVAAKNKTGAAHKEAIINKIRMIKSYFGIDYHHLEKMWE